MPGSDTQLVYLAGNADDHLPADGTKVIGPARPSDRAVHYNHLSADAAQDLAANWRDRSGAAIAEVATRAVRLQDVQPRPMRTGADTYFWEVDRS